MRFRRSMAALIAGAVVALLPAVSTPAHAAPRGADAVPTIASDGCTFEVISVHARNLRHDNAHDEVLLRLGQTWFPSATLWRTFTLNQVRPASHFNNPTMGYLTTLQVRLSVNGFPFNTALDETFLCAEEEGVRTFSNGNGSILYDVAYRITTG